MDQSLVGLIVGSQGSQVKRIQDEFSVYIQVEKATIGGGDKRKITISGKTERNVDDAIEEIVLERIFIPFDNKLIEYVCGPNEKNLSFFYEKSGVVQLNIEQQKQTGKFEIAAIGTHHALDDLRTIVQTHINLFDRYQEKEDQRKNLQQQQRKVYYNPPTTTSTPANDSNAPMTARGGQQAPQQPQYQRKK